MNKEVKPCPFCGGEDIRYEEDDLIVIYCYECDCQSRRCETIEEAIEAWNRREPMDKIVEQLEKEKGIAFVTLANTGNKELDFTYQNVVAYMDKAIEIVKSGGKV